MLRASPYRPKSDLPDHFFDRALHDPTRHLPRLSDVRSSPEGRVALENICVVTREHASNILRGFDPSYIRAVETSLQPEHVWPALGASEGELKLRMEFRHQMLPYEGPDNILPVGEVPATIDWSERVHVSGEHYEYLLPQESQTQAWRHAFANAYSRLLRDMEIAFRKGAGELADWRAQQLKELDEEWAARAAVPEMHIDR